MFTQCPHAAVPHCRRCALLFWLRLPSAAKGVPLRHVTLGAGNGSASLAIACPAEAVLLAVRTGQGPGHAEASLAAQCPLGAAPGDTTRDLTIAYDLCQCAAAPPAAATAASETPKPCGAALLQEQRAGSPSAGTSAEATALRSRASTPAPDSTSGLARST